MSISRHTPLTHLLVSLAFTASCLAPAGAQTPSNRGELADIERQLNQRRREEARLKDEAATRAKEVAALRQNMVETAQALQDAERRIAAISAQIEKLSAEESQLTQNLEGEQRRLSDILGALQSLERGRPPALLFSPQDSTKAARTALLLAGAAPELKAKADELRAAIEQLNMVREELTRERAAFEKTNEEISSRRSVLAELLRDKQEERSVARKLAEAAQSETAALAARATTLRGVLARLERLARSITPRMKPNNQRLAVPGTVARATPSLKFSPPKAFSSARGKLPVPVVGPLIARFGARRPDGGRFDGVRFASSANAIVTAPFDASVEFAQYYPATGNLIVLNVGEGYHILLMGVGSFLVSEGQNVSAGEPIGVMTGANPQLDLEIRRAREPVNPSLWLSGKTGG
ncbi:MAG: hypothetical protein EVA70_05425 [Parvularculaceae bacterium]|nr:MAG: hypothetical protein EVA70_05425 [Parvularculaceae bacterium]